MNRDLLTFVALVAVFGAALVAIAAGAAITGPDPPYHVQVMKFGVIAGGTLGTVAVTVFLIWRNVREDDVCFVCLHPRSFHNHFSGCEQKMCKCDRKHDEVEAEY